MAWLQNTTALVTGGGSGIGRAVVERFIAEGAHVGVLEISREKCEQLSADFGSSVVAIEGDVTKLADNHRAVRETVAAFGRLDTFIGNSGISDGFVSLAAFTDDNLEAVFDSLFDVNVKGCLFGAKAALPALLDSNGSMIFTASGAGFATGAGGLIYTATKHAVVGLIRQLAYELAPKIRVNGVAPCGTLTDLRLPPALGAGPDALGIRAFDHVPDVDERMRAVTPLHVFPSSSDHAGAYVFLASRENAGVLTGTIIRTDGGLQIRGVTSAAGGDDL